MLRPSDEDDATILSLTIFILQMLSLAFFSWLFYRLLTPCELKRQESHHPPRYDHVPGYKRSSKTGHTKDRSKHTNAMARLSRASPCHPYLPQELVEEIIDCLWDDKPSLRACALTSRKWTHRSRKHLYYTLTIRRGRCDPYTLRFHRQLLSCVRHVVIRGDLWREVLHSPLSGRTEIERLDLENDATSGTSMLNKSCFPRFPGLRTLTLRRVHFRTYQDMLEVLAPLKHLTSLTVDLSRFYWAYIGPEDVVPDVQLSIESLCLRLCSMPVLAGYTFRSQSILRSSGENLKYLDLRFGTFAPEPNTAASQLIAAIESLDLSNNISLQSLEFAFRWTSGHVYSRIQRSMGRRFALSLLSQIHSGQCRSLTFHIQITWWTEYPMLRYVNMHMFDYLAEPTIDIPSTRETMERVLTCAGNLQSVVLKLLVAPSLDGGAFSSLEHHIRAQLRKLDERGILRIQRSTESIEDFT